MPVEERQRLALRRQVSASWGEEAADTLFELLTPAGHELATREDLRVGFDEVDRRFEKVDRRFEKVDRRFEEVDRRFEEVDRRFERVDHRFDLLEERFTSLENRLDTRFAAMGERFERRISDAVTTQTRTLVLSQLAALVAIAGLAFGLQ